MPELPRAELADHRASPPVRQALRLVLGGATQVMAALLAIVIGISIHLLHDRRIYSGHATAHVLDYRVVGVGAPAYHVDIGYRDDAGRDHTGSIFVRGGRIQTSYPVDYDPDQPDRVVWHQPWYTDVVLVVVLLVFGTGALGGLGVAMWVGVQKLRRRDSIRGGPVAPLLLLPAVCVALAVVLWRALAG